MKYRKFKTLRIWCGLQYRNIHTKYLRNLFSSSQYETCGSTFGSVGQTDMTSHIILFLLSIIRKESNEESGKNYAKNLPHIADMAFSLLTKRNQVPGHLITSLDIYRLLAFLYNKIQNIVPLCQIPCLLYFRHYCLSKQHLRENSDITFYHFTNPTSSPIQLNKLNVSLHFHCGTENRKSFWSAFYQKYLRREFKSHIAFRYDQAINYFSFHLFQLSNYYKTETHTKEYILWL